MDSDCTQQQFQQAQQVLPPPQQNHVVMMPPQHQFQQQMQHQNASFGGFQMNSAAASAMGGKTNVELSDGSPKKKRGRPRKYSPKGGSVGLAALSPSSAGGTDSGAKRTRGRPPGSGKKQLDALGSTGIGFTPHVIFVKTGEDISAKIMAFAQQGPRTVCILCATGSICNVTLRQAAMSSGNVTYEGRFEIISLSGSFLPSENLSGVGGLSISLAGSDGKVVGGSVAGKLIAASPIQVVVGSFVSDFKKLKAKPPSAAPSSNIVNFSAPAAGVASSPSPSQGPSSGSSEENHDSSLDNGPGPYSNAAQTIQNMSMYSPVSWPNSSIKMPPS